METPNLTYIKELSDGDLEFEKQLISVVKRELPDEYQDFLDNYESKNFKKTAESVHKLKHKISILGLEKGYQLASEFEIDLKEHHKVALFDPFKDIIEAMLTYIKPL